MRLLIFLLEGAFRVPLETPTKPDTARLKKNVVHHHIILE